MININMIQNIDIKNIIFNKTLNIHILKIHEFYKIILKFKIGILKYVY